MLSSILIFANPISGRGKGRALAERLAEQLTRAGVQVHLCADRPELAPGELTGNANAVVSVGGDGTLRAVTQVLLERHGERMPPIIVAPLGTANLMAQHLELPWRTGDPVSGILQCLRRHRVRRIDAATANGSLFMLVAGVGIDGAIVHELAKARTGAISMLSYVAPGVRSFLTHEFDRLTVNVDGVEVARSVQSIAFVGNVREYGTGFAVLPHASSSDGWLDVCVLPCKSRGDLLHIGLRAFAQEHMLHEGAVYVKGREILIESDGQSPVQIDGDPGGFTPLHIRLLPVKVPFIVPA